VFTPKQGSDVHSGFVGRFVGRTRTLSRCVFLQDACPRAGNGRARNPYGPGRDVTGASPSRGAEQDPPVRISSDTVNGRIKAFWRKTAGRYGRPSSAAGELLFFQQEVFSAFLKGFDRGRCPSPTSRGTPILGNGHRWRQAASEGDPQEKKVSFHNRALGAGLQRAGATRTSQDASRDRGSPVDGERGCPQVQIK
jgi:hypothetical protein